MTGPLTIPSSLEEITLEWLNGVLNPHEIKVVDFSFLGDAKKGRGYLSDLIRLQLQVIKNKNNAPEEMRLVLKSVPSDPNVRAYVLRVGYCQNEVQMYTKVLPEITSFLESRGVSEANYFSFPKCYLGLEEEGSKPEDYNYILVLEDLLASHYKLWEEGPKKSFDWSHTSAAIKSIARFHAASAVYKIAKGFKTYEDKFPKFVKHSIDEPALDNYIRTGFQTTRELLAEKEDLPKGLMDRLDVLEKNFKPIVQKMLIDIDLEALNVIRHSDLHVFNTAFRYDMEDKCKDCVWFDFQNCSEGRPMLDLGFFLILNCEPEFSADLLEQSLKLYHDTFKNIFLEAKIDLQYSLEDVKDEFKQYRKTSILHIISGAPVWVGGQHGNQVSRDRLRRAIIYAYENGELEVPKFVE